MKKNTVKAFTLVEMLIVIVIIGILIASLMPRMQSAQWRARDVARKNDLAQIQTAIITSQQDRGGFPGTTSNTWTDTNGTTTTEAWNAITVDKISDNLQKAGMSSVPSDPNWSNDNYGLWNLNTGSNENNYWKYLYLVATRNWVSNAWFVLMAKTEVEWWSNWVTCQSHSTGLDYWYITNATDLANVKTCKTFNQTTSCEITWDTCNYKEAWELRYILLY